MQLQSAPSLMNTTNARSLPSSTAIFRRATGASAHPRTPDFANTLPMDLPETPTPTGGSLRGQLLPELLTTYLVVYLLVFVITLAVLILSTDLSLALDVVMLVARESLWFTPIAGTVLVLNPWRRATRRGAGRAT
jgi:hypothetical protein